MKEPGAVRVTASRTMILLDPDLELPREQSAVRRGSDPDPVPQRGTSRADSRTSDAKNRVPTARTLSRFLRAAQAAVRLKGQVSVLLTTDTAMRRLNRQFRGKNKATDVLSFPAADYLAGEVAGDLAISVPTARQQAASQGHALGVEIKVLMLHGLLHLAGFDHETDEGQMGRRERLLRTKLKLPVGLIERSSDPAHPVQSRGGKKPGTAGKRRRA